MFSASWPGLSRPSTFLKQTLEEIIPLRVGLQNQPHLPSSRPMLHILFALDRRADIVVNLKIDELFQSVSFGEPLNCGFPMLSNTSNKIAGPADVERAIRPIGENVNVP